MADTVVVVGGGTANSVNAIANALGKTANGLADAAPGNAAYLAEKTNYLTNNAASGFKALGIQALLFAVLTLSYSTNPLITSLHY